MTEENNNTLIVSLHKSVNNFTSQIDGTLATKKTYQYAIKQYFDYLAESGADATEPSTVLGYKNHLIEQGHKMSTVNNYLMAVKRLYAYLEDEGVCKNVAKKVKKVREDKQFKKDCLTIEQSTKILNSMNRNTLKGKRDYALMSLLLMTGLRTIEVVRAQVGDIRNKGNQTVLYVQGKGHLEKDSFVVLPEVVQNAIGEYLTAREGVTDESPLFEGVGNRSNGPMHVKSVSRLIKTIFKQNGLVSDRLTAHSTRHTACTLALLSGATLQDTQAMARHQNINTTLIYAHNLDRLGNSAENKIASLFA